MTGPVVRGAPPPDPTAGAAVYAPYVLGTAASFETDPPTPAEMARRITSAQQDHAWLVAVVGDVLVGYAYATAWRPRAAYRWTCEVSVYVERDQRGGGVGRALYTALLERLAERGYRTVLAGMTLPNAASAGLHAALGFTPAGVLERVGWKAGRWHDVALLRRSLGTGPDDAPPLIIGG